MLFGNLEQEIVLTGRDVSMTCRYDAYYEFLQVSFIISSIAKSWKMDLFEMRYFIDIRFGNEQLLQREYIAMGIWLMGYIV